MAATPKNGVMTFVGRSGQTYSKDVYVSDVANALINWDGGIGSSATSPEEWRAPEPLVLTDFAMVTGTAETTKIQITRNSVGTGDILRYLAHLTSLNQRPALRLPFLPGDVVGAIQLA